jgi:peptidoglycan-N-acetylglucosamine deacetylase
VAKPNRIFWRSLTFITLLVAVGSFIIGVNWPINQSDQSTAQITQQSPLNQDLVLNSPKTTATPSDKSVFVPEPFTTTTPSLKPDIPPNSSTLPTPEARETPIEGISSIVNTARQQLAETFPIPSEFRAKIVKKIKSVGSEKVIALTFDDGPWPHTTPTVLEILKKEDIKATFFWVGQYLKAHPEIAKQVIAEGHAIGNHTWHHWYRQMSKPTAAQEIEDTAELIYKITGVKSLVFRPPGGLLNNGVADYAKAQNYVTVMWSVDSMDYRPYSATELVKNVMRKVEPGAIVLMHDGGGNRPATVKALPEIIAQLKKQNYSFVTVPQLLEMNNKQQIETIAKPELSDSPLLPNNQYQ